MVIHVRFDDWLSNDITGEEYSRGRKQAQVHKLNEAEAGTCV